MTSFFIPSHHCPEYRAENPHSSYPKPSKNMNLRLFVHMIFDSVITWYIKIYLGEMLSNALLIWTSFIVLQKIKTKNKTDI